MICRSLTTKESKTKNWMLVYASYRCTDDLWLCVNNQV